MPFTPSSENLPMYVKKLPEKIRLAWIEIFNSVYDTHGEEQAFVVANTWLKRKLHEVSAKARTNTIQTQIIKFTIDETQPLKRSESGEEYLSAVLVNDNKNLDGVVFTEQVMKEWADYINAGNALVGDIDHSFYDEVLKRTASEDTIKHFFKMKKGIAKAIKAIYENGKLYVRLIIDKRYKNQIAKAKGLSLEAIVKKNSNNEVLGGDLLGFTFGVGTEPMCPETGVIA